MLSVSYVQDKKTEQQQMKMCTKLDAPADLMRW